MYIRSFRNVRTYVRMYVRTYVSFPDVFAVANSFHVNKMCDAVQSHGGPPCLRVACGCESHAVRMHHFLQCRVYVRTYVCTYVRMYLRNYVSMYAHVRMYVRGRTGVRTYVRTVPYVRAYVRKYVRTYVRTCVRICFVPEMSTACAEYVRTCVSA